SLNLRFNYLPADLANTTIQVRERARRRTTTRRKPRGGVTETGGPGGLRKVKRFARTVRARQAVDLSARGLAVEVDIAGATASVRVNGTSASFKVRAGGPAFMASTSTEWATSRRGGSRRAPSSHSGPRNPGNATSAVAL